MAAMMQQQQQQHMRHNLRLPSLKESDIGLSKPGKDPSGSLLGANSKDQDASFLANQPADMLG
jgi:hypothetical protein